MNDLIKKTISKPLYAACVVIVGVVIILALYSVTIYKNSKDEVITTLSETSIQTAKALKNKIIGDQRAIEDVATMISDDRYLAADSMEALEKIVENHRLLRIGIVKRDCSVTTTDGKIHSLPERDYIRAALNGESSVSQRLVDVVDGQTIIVYAAPIYGKDWKSVDAVLFATFSIAEYHATVTTDAFGDKGRIYVVNKSGEAISALDEETEKVVFDVIFDVLKEMDSGNLEKAEQLKDGMLNNGQGYFEYVGKKPNGHKLKKYLYYTPLGINDWYLLMTAPADVLNNKLFSTLASTFVLGCIIVAVCTAILGLMLKIQNDAKKNLEKIVYVDKVTGNRSYEKFKLDAKEILAGMKKGDAFAIVSLDIDKFKYINDLFGYAEGDNLIRFIDNSLVHMCRQGELSAHIDADDFIMLLRYETKQQLCDRLDQLKTSIEEYKRADSRTYKIVLSMGVYEIRSNEIDMDTMKDRAEIPRKQLKADKTTVYAFYDETVRKKILHDRDIENNMATALEQNEFVVFYQPKFWAHDKSFSGAEALVRWKKKDGTIVSPGDFIPLFEENGFIVQLDRYVFNQVCADIKKWIAQGYKVHPISTNLSRKNIGVKNLAEQCEKAVQAAGIPKQLVAIELTETAFVENENVIGDFVSQLKDRGFNILMDDFGTGFSSLGLLIEMDIDTLKLDRALVRDIDKNIKSPAVVEVAIKLMHRWNAKVNAEGVETREQFEYLKQLQCDEIQGFYFARPMPAEEFEKLMSKV